MVDRDLDCEGRYEGSLRIHLSGWVREEQGGLTSMLTDPSTFNSSPSRADRREDFPAPTGPTTASRQPCGTVRLILRTQGKYSSERSVWVCTETGNPKHTRPVLLFRRGETIKRIHRAVPPRSLSEYLNRLPSHT